MSGRRSIAAAGLDYTAAGPDLWTAYSARPRRPASTGGRERPAAGAWSGPVLGAGAAAGRGRWRPSLPGCVPPSAIFLMRREPAAGRGSGEGGAVNARSILNHNDAGDSRAARPNGSLDYNIRGIHHHEMII